MDVCLSYPNPKKNPKNVRDRIADGRVNARTARCSTRIFAYGVKAPGNPPTSRRAVGMRSLKKVKIENKQKIEKENLAIIRSKKPFLFRELYVEVVRYTTSTIHTYLTFWRVKTICICDKSTTNKKHKKPKKKLKKPTTNSHQHPNAMVSETKRQQWPDCKLIPFQQGYYREWTSQHDATCSGNRSETGFY